MMYFYIENLLHSSGIRQKVIFESVQNPISMPEIKSFSPSDFPGSPVVKNLPSNAGDAGSIPGRGTKIPHAVGATKPARQDY